MPVPERKSKLESERFVRSHYLGRILAWIRLPAPRRALLVALSSYIVFLIFAVLGDWHSAIGSFLHAWQITFSITLFLATWFGYEILESVQTWLENAKESLKISDDDSVYLSKTVVQSLGSKWSLAFGLLFISPGIAVGVMIASSLPNNLFPFSGTMPAFVYAVLIEFCLGMLMILGAGCWVIIFVFAQAASKLSQLPSVNYDLVDDDSLSSLSQTALRNCIFMLVTIASAMPGVAYVGFSFGNRQISFIVIVFGLLLPTIGIASSFFAPNHYLTKMLREAKGRRVSRIREQIRICDDKLETKVMHLSDTRPANLDVAYRRLSDLSAHLHLRLLQAKAEPTRSFHTSSILRLAGSSLLPALTFFLERILKSFLP